MNTDNPDPMRVHRHGDHSDREALAVTAVLALPCALAVAGSALPGLDALITTGVVGLLGLVVLAVVLRLAARWLRERLEDAADTRTATAWRARHAAQLPADTSASIKAVVS